MALKIIAENYDMATAIKRQYTSMSTQKIYLPMFRHPIVSIIAEYFQLSQPFEREISVRLRPIRTALATSVSWTKIIKYRGEWGLVSPQTYDDVVWFFYLTNIAILRTIVNNHAPRGDIILDYIIMAYADEIDEEYLVLK